jgi:D-psicose/D-tagatose/L-ribulose 3-epimerase
VIRLGVHGMVWTGGWEPAERRRAIAASAAAGYDLIEIPALDPAELDPDDTLSLLREHGLEAVCSLGLRPHTDVSSEDPDTVARGREVLAGALEAVRAMDGDVLCGVVYGALGRYERPATARGRRHALDTVAWLCEQAGDGITIALEVVNRYETNLLNTAEQALQFADEVGAPNLGVHLDTYHMNIEEAGLAAPVRLCGDRLAYVHVGESHRGAPGTGTIDFDELFGALAAIGYDGTVTFESFSSAVVHRDLSSTLCIWRDLWEDGMALAAGARSFMVDGLRRAGLATS